MIKVRRIDMQEATRLTRAGRLQEAMALLQGRAPATSASEPQRAGPDANQAPIDPPQPRGPGDRGLWPFAGQIKTVPAASMSQGLGRMSSELLTRLRPRAGIGKPASAAEPTLPEGARFERRTFTLAGASRRYRLYVPASIALGTTDARAPLVVMLHGCKQSPEDFAVGTGMNRLAEEQGCLVVYPEQSPAANGSCCWNWFNRADQQRGRGEPGLIAGMTQEVITEYPVDPARVYVAGLSAGGAAAALLARNYPDLFAAVGVHSGLASGAASDVASAFAAMRQGSEVPASSFAEKPFPAIVFHGDKDQVVHPINGEQVADQARAGHKMTQQVSRGSCKGGGEYTRRVEANAAGKPMLEHWTLHGAGHAWSGGDVAGSYTNPSGPDASAEMMRFFCQHTLASAAAFGA